MEVKRTLPDGAWWQQGSSGILRVTRDDAWWQARPRSCSSRQIQTWTRSQSGRCYKGANWKHDLDLVKEECRVISNCIKQVNRHIHAARNSTKSVWVQGWRSVRNVKVANFERIAHSARSADNLIIANKEGATDSDVSTINGWSFFC